MWRASRGGGENELVASFEQRGADRSGLGIGLTFSRPESPLGSHISQTRTEHRNEIRRICVDCGTAIFGTGHGQIVRRSSSSEIIEESSLPLGRRPGYVACLTPASGPNQT
jgi:hypothetical protein